MDFLDPQKQKAHAIRMHIGYILLAVTLGIATIILLYQVSGYGFGKNGEIIQNGLVFVGSQPGGADILVDGMMKATTGARLVLPSGQYTFRIQRDGYRIWQRSVGVVGGRVEHFTYPLLVPSKLSTVSIKKYATAPAIETESLDHRWLVVQKTDANGVFDVFDLAHPKNPPSAIAVPAAVMSPSNGPQSWSAVQWASDNRHLLLKHIFQKNGQPASEYVLLDRQNPDQSQNLTTLLGVNPTTLTLRNQIYNQYYTYNQATKIVSRASLQAPQPIAFIDHVLAFESAGSDSILYTSDDSAAPAGGMNVRLRQGGDDYVLGHLPQGPAVLALAQYNSDWYMAFGSSAESKVYVYKNPAATLQGGDVLVPAAILKVAHPNMVAFSAGSQFVMAENGQNFAVFDVENTKNYAYHLGVPLDAPETAAAWMDNDRLMLTSGGKLVIFDFDSANQQTLAANDAAFTPVFDERYATLYTIIPQTQPLTGALPAATTYDLSSTSLLTPADQ